MAPSFNPLDSEKNPTSSSLSLPVTFHPHHPPEKCEDSSDLPPPDGGARAWTQVLVAHLVAVNAWGYLNSFGLFQSHYQEALPTVSPSRISLVGSLQIFLSFLIGSLSGRALDAGYLRPCLALGSALQIIGIFTTSVATRYWHFVLAHGLCKGLGDGLVFTPATAVVGTYFRRKRALAMGIGAAGTATGGLIFPVIAQRLMGRIGFAWTVRVMGCVVVVNAGVIMACSRARLVGRRGPLFEWRAFRERPYTLFCVGMFLNWWALYFAFFYISVFAKNKLGIDGPTSLTLLLVMNAAGGPSRVIFGLLADKWHGPLQIIIPLAFCTGVLFYSWAAVHSLGGLFAFCITYGFIASGVAGLFPPACAGLATDLKSVGARTGMCFAVVSFATLTGPPIGGALVQLNHGGYLYGQIFGGSAFMVGTLCLVAAKITISRGR
ncbi:major facilitator superfamily domain-containing protein [Podospora aff. communis PSN243]|uniref:Major facilitator superfamily domain-containing protein n=1 Tax=Podospora aff. communis PSN243 TaxID=3040156 RepID=A0AAV9GIT6_9PEZI|nr:major facilitator superfamily domain-containing protein [Podospora aff. communis PSN243]